MIQVLQVIVSMDSASKLLFIRHHLLMHHEPGLLQMLRLQPPELRCASRQPELCRLYKFSKMGIYHPRSPFPALSMVAMLCSTSTCTKRLIKINEFLFHTFKRVRAPENSFSSSWLPKRDLSFVDKVHHPLQIGKFRNWHYCETSSSIFKDFPSSSFKMT